MCAVWDVALSIMSDDDAPTPKPTRPTRHHRRIQRSDDDDDGVETEMARLHRELANAAVRNGVLRADLELYKAWAIALGVFAGAFVVFAGWRVLLRV